MRDGTAGFTLIEVMVSLALFALIGGAGVSVLDQVLRAQVRTEAQLDGLAAMQRAMLLITLDFAQAGPASVMQDQAGVQVGHGAVTVIYAVQDGVLMRAFGDVQQPVLAGVAGVGWQFLDAQNGWLEAWPVAEDLTNPRAIAVTLDLGAKGQIRRVVGLPGQPE
jgi:general secretion pathway protein J